MAYGSVNVPGVPSSALDQIKQIADEAKETAQGAASASHTHTLSDITDCVEPPIQVDTVPTKDSTAFVTSGTVYTALAGKSDTSHTHSRVYASSSHTHSDYAPKASPVFTSSISLGRKSGTTVESYSVAVGDNVTASGYCAHAEGHDSVASGKYSHAEGHNTMASGLSSHVEGYDSLAEGPYSHCEGLYTGAFNYASHVCGKYNKDTINGGSLNNTIGDVFVIGNGTGANAYSNAFRVTYAGQVYGLSAFNSTGADYAEYFEWADGNSNNEDRVGYFVTLEGDKIKKAQQGDYILGIVSGQPCIIGNADEDWLGRWLHDEYGRFVLEYLEDEKVEISTEGLTEEEIISLQMEPDVQKEEDKLYRIVPKVVDYETPSWRYKANPDYDNTQEYVERKDRKEWSAIGMVGVLSVKDDGTCQVNGFCKVNDEGIAVSSENEFTIENGKIIKSYRVVKRIADNVIKVVFR